MSLWPWAAAVAVIVALVAWFALPHSPATSADAPDGEAITDAAADGEGAPPASPDAVVFDAPEAGTFLDADALSGVGDDGGPRSQQPNGSPTVAGNAPAAGSARTAGQGSPPTPQQPDPAVGAPAATPAGAASPLPGGASGAPASPDAVSPTSSAAAPSSPAAQAGTAGGPSVPAPSSAAPAAAKSPTASLWDAPVATTEARARFTSDPAGATLLVDGRAVGRTPLELTLPYGAHDIELRLDGHMTVRKRIDVATPTPAYPETLQRVLRRGEVLLAVPGQEGREVAIDGVVRGVLPLRVTLSEGRHTFTVTTPTGPVTIHRDVALDETGVTPLTLRLTP